jgi:hypothetical protein
MDPEALLPAPHTIEDVTRGHATPNFQFHRVGATFSRANRSPHSREASAVRAGRSLALILTFRRARTLELKIVLPCERSKWTAKELLRSLRRIQQAEVRARCNGGGQLQKKELVFALYWRAV